MISALANKNNKQKSITPVAYSLIINQVQLNVSEGNLPLEITPVIYP